jgi:hypothetical protein
MKFEQRTKVHKVIIYFALNAWKAFYVVFARWKIKPLTMMRRNARERPSSLMPELRPLTSEAVVESASDPPASPAQTSDP